MLIDSLAVWFQRKTPDTIHVVTATTSRTVLFEDPHRVPDLVITDQPHPLPCPVLPQGCSARRIIIAEIPPLAGEDGTEPVGYVTSADPPETLVEAITAVTAGYPFISASVRGLHRPEGAVKLTAKQRHVVALYVDGLSVLEVAEQVGVTPNTVASYLKLVRAKYRAAGIPVSTKIELGAALVGATPPTAHGSVLALLPKEHRHDPPREPAGLLRWPSGAGLARIKEKTNWDQFSTVMSTLQISATLEITPADVLDRFADGTIPAYRFGKYWVVFTAEFRAWITTRSTTGSTQVPPVDVLAGYDDTMTYKDLMGLFERSKKTIYLWIADGIIPGFKIGNRWLVRTHYLRQALNENSNQSLS